MFLKSRPESMSAQAADALPPAAAAATAAATAAAAADASAAAAAAASNAQISCYGVRSIYIRGNTGVDKYIYFRIRGRRHKKIACEAQQSL